jgi:hypothetical protein
MAAMKYSNCIMTDSQPRPPEIQNKLDEQRRTSQSTVESTHLLTVDGGRVKDFFFVDCTWLWKGHSEGTLDEPHFHDFDEVIGFVGANREDPQDLGGEISLWLEDERKVLTKSCLIFIPAGIVHGPVRFDRIEKPIFSVTIAPTGKYSRSVVKASPKAAKIQDAKDPSRPKYTIITETKAKFSVAASGGSTPPPPPRDPSLKSARILHLEDDMAKGAFYVDFVWIYEGNGGAPAPEHTHEWVELIAMAGADPEHPHDLGGTMSIVLGDETHYITKSSLVCIPAGLKHCPWKFVGIKKPTLVFTAGPSGMYTGSHKDKW